VHAALVLNANCVCVCVCVRAGAFDGINSRVTPSFILMSIKKNKVVVYVYELPPGAKKPTVAKTEFTKNDD
jgi:hypothetical protein